MKLLITITLILFLSCSAPIDKKDTPTTANDSKPASNGNFSAYQGKMNWNDAKAKCASLGMRLPTRDELVAVYKAGVGEEWRNDDWYWTSEDYSAKGAYGFTMSTGLYSGNDKGVSNISVRCIR